MIQGAKSKSIRGQAARAIFGPRFLSAAVHSQRLNQDTGNKANNVKQILEILEFLESIAIQIQLITRQSPPRITRRHVVSISVDLTC